MLFLKCDIVQSDSDYDQYFIKLYMCDVKTNHFHRPWEQKTHKSDKLLV